MSSKDNQDKTISQYATNVLSTPPISKATQQPSTHRISPKDVMTMLKHESPLSDPLLPHRPSSTSTTSSTATSLKGFAQQLEPVELHLKTASTEHLISALKTRVKQLQSMGGKCVPGVDPIVQISPRLKACEPIEGEDLLDSESMIKDPTLRLLKASFDEARQACLQDLYDHASLNAREFMQVFGDLFRLFEVSVLKPLPPHVNPYGEEYDVEEDEPVMDPSWPVIHYVYALIIRVIESSFFDPAQAKDFLDARFVDKLLPLFDSEDPREREALKSVLHRVYGKMLSLRSYIRARMAIIFAETAQGEFLHYIAEMLEVLGSIVNGYAVPLKPEHADYLMNTLMPLHRCRHLATFYTPLTYCVLQILEKDQSLVIPVLNYLLRSWPKAASSKEVMFVNELEEMLELVNPETTQHSFEQIAERVWRRLAACVSSLHFQVAERALFFWNNELIIRRLLRKTISIAMPILVPALNSHINDHWNKNVQTMTSKAIKVMQEIDPTLYARCFKKAIANNSANSLNKTTRSQSLQEQKEEREELWRHVLYGKGDEIEHVDSVPSSLHNNQNNIEFQMPKYHQTENTLTTAFKYRQDLGRRKSTPGSSGKK